jgi:hypothetical protein
MTIESGSSPTWERLGKYAIRSPCSVYTICFVKVLGTATYELWKQSKRLSAHPTVEEAKQAYEVQGK